MSTPTQPAGAALSIPSEFIRPIIQEKINLAILEAMQGKQTLVAEAVAVILKTKVAYNGGPVQYSGSNSDVPWIEYTVKDAVQKAAPRQQSRHGGRFAKGFVVDRPDLNLQTLNRPQGFNRQLEYGCEQCSGAKNHFGRWNAGWQFWQWFA